MDFTELRLDANDGKYDNIGVFPSMSMAIDQEHFKKLKVEYQKSKSNAYKKFKSDCISAVNDELGFELAIVPFEEMFRIAWDIGHSNGYLEVANYLYDLCPLVQKTVESIKQQITEDNAGESI